MGKKRVEKKGAEQKGQWERLCPLYLEHMKATSFGRFANLIVGPFKPGMNVVYGPNEAGKSTLNALVRGVLFGWPAARGQANPYKPESTGRVGSLFFRDEDTGEVAELKRAKNGDSLQPPAPLLTDIDAETFDTMFALTSDELLQLDRHTEVTARLLTAGSGTGSSPARALASIDARIKALTSRSSANPDSIANLRAEADRLRAEVRIGEDEAAGFLAQEKALAALEPRRETLAAAQGQLNDEIETLTAQAERLRVLDESISAAHAAAAEARSARARAEEDAQSSPPAEIAELIGLSQAEEYRLLDSLDDLDERRAALEHAADGARRDAGKSRAEYEVLVEDAQAQDQQARANRSRKARLALAIAVPLVMLAAAAYVLWRVQAVGGLRLSYLIGGAALVVFALIIAAAGVVFAMRPTPVEETLSEERKKSKWVMQQDAKAQEACERDVTDHAARIEGYLASNGLAAAQGSIRRARRLVDQARGFRSSHASARQNAHALELQCASLEHEGEMARDARAALCREMGLPPDATQTDAQKLIDVRAEERERTMQLVRETDRQIGEITQQLAAARGNVDFDRVKAEAEVNKARLDVGYRKLATLLVARDALSAAIAEWERKSQPEVYARASRLLTSMTGGAWQTVRMNAAGEIEVVDAAATLRSPNLLSLGTRQQLYLSLRIALLLTAQNVGRGLPILCDDILVNFDDERRVPAARALCELAQSRQVILFTCHRDIAALVQDVDPKGNLVEL